MLAPRPRASVARATAVNPGCCRSRRSARRTSSRRVPIGSLVAWTRAGAITLPAFAGATARQARDGILTGPMMSTDDEAVDRLYQLPLAEFTAARNALAKGGDPSVKALQKPSLPAWAVNQLYWQRRKVFDRLIAAAGRVRTAHGRMLTGRAADVAEAETAHAAAVKESVEQIREILRAAGDAESPATIVAVQETLQALPADDEPPGRLTRPLKPKGFEALAGLVPASGLRAFKVVGPRAPSRAPAAAKPAKAPSAAEAAAEKRAAEARKREADELDAALREAKKAEREATTALDRARTKRDDAEREHADLTKKLDAL